MAELEYLNISLDCTELELLEQEISNKCINPENESKNQSEQDNNENIDLNLSLNSDISIGSLEIEKKITDIETTGSKHAF